MSCARIVMAPVFLRLVWSRVYLATALFYMLSETQAQGDATCGHFGWQTQLSLDIE